MALPGAPGACAGTGIVKLRQAEQAAYVRTPLPSTARGRTVSCRRCAGTCTGSRSRCNPGPLWRCWVSRPMSLGEMQRPPDPGSRRLVEHAAGRLRAIAGAISVRALAAELDLSERRRQQLFAAQIGRAPPATSAWNASPVEDGRDPAMGSDGAAQRVLRPVPHDQRVPRAVWPDAAAVPATCRFGFFQYGGRGSGLRSLAFRNDSRRHP